MPLNDCKIGPAAAVSDIDRAAEFYEGVLGLEPAMKSDEMRTYPCGGGTTLAVYVSPENAGTNTATLAGFEASDFDSLHAELKDRGVSFEQYNGEGGITTDENGIFTADEFRAAWFKDPDGNTFAING